MPPKSRETTGAQYIGGKAVPGGMADHVDHRLRIEAGFRSQNIETTLRAREAMSAGPDPICAPSAAVRSFSRDRCDRPRVGARSSKCSGRSGRLLLRGCCCSTHPRALGRRLVPYRCGAISSPRFALPLTETLSRSFHTRDYGSNVHRPISCVHEYPRGADSQVTGVNGVG
jgi:hypothetical protein